MTPMEADIMDTITQSEANNIIRSLNIKPIRVSLVACAVVSSFPASAKFDLNAIATADTIYQSVDTDDEGQRSLTTLTIAPKLNATYQTKTFQGLW